MPQNDPNATQVRELVDLDVQEVSLVDHPAIKRTFLVVKRDEATSKENTMSKDAAAAADAAAKEDEGKSEGTEKAPGLTGNDHSYSQETRGKNAEYLKQIGMILEEAVKANPEYADAAKWAMEYLGKYDEMAMAQEKAKADGDAHTTLVEAGKSITAAQLTSLKAAHNHFGTLLNTLGLIKAEEDVDEEMKGDKAKAAAMGTALGSEVAKAMEPVAKALKSMNERLETVEKTRGSARGEGDDTTTTVQKGGDNLWNGLF